MFFGHPLRLRRSAARRWSHSTKLAMKRPMLDQIWPDVGQIWAAGRRNQDHLGQLFEQHRVLALRLCRVGVQSVDAYEAVNRRGGQGAGFKTRACLLSSFSNPDHHSVAPFQPHLHLTPREPRGPSDSKSQRRCVAL